MTTEPNPQDMVRCEHLCRRFDSAGDPVTVLDDVSFRVHEGEFVAVLGPSGSGKSTLLGLLAGLDRPSSGRVWIAGSDLSVMDEGALAALRREAVGFIFQSFQLLDNLTALENVLIPLELLGVANAEDRSAELLAAVGLSERTRHYPSQLSGGEQQRVAVARAFGTRPRLLLADEPTGNLDRANGLRVLEQLLALRAEQGTTLVLVTHDNEIARQADRRLHLEGGRLVRDESTGTG